MILGKSMSHLLKASYNQELRNPPEGAREVGGLDRDSPELGLGVQVGSLPLQVTLLKGVLRRGLQ